MQTDATMYALHQGDVLVASSAITDVLISLRHKNQLNKTNFAFKTILEHDSVLCYTM